MTTGRLPSAEKRKQIKTMAAAGWPAAKISETLKVAMPTVQRVLSQNTSSASAGKGEERANLVVKPNPRVRDPQNNTPSAQAEGGLGPLDHATPSLVAEPASYLSGIGAIPAALGGTALMPDSATAAGYTPPDDPWAAQTARIKEILPRVEAGKKELPSNISSAQAEGGIDPSSNANQTSAVDPAKIHSKRVNVTAKLRARVIKLLDLGETDFFIEVATGLNSDQLKRIKKEYQSAKADSGIDQTPIEAQHKAVDPATLSPSGASQEPPHHAAKPVQVMAAPGDQSKISLTLMELQARRVAAVKALIQQQNATGAYVRRALGFSTDQEEKDREKIRKQAATLIKKIEAFGPAHNPEADRVWNAVAAFVLAAQEARKPFEAMRADIETAMRAEAQKLAVWPWYNSNRGCGALGLGIIVGETGDLANYATASRVWKRLGLAVIGGKAQGRPGTGATAEDWIGHGYNPRRRSALWTVGDSLLKNNDTGVYRALYLARKQFELDKAKAEGREMTAGHIHRRAQRCMEKKLIADLWAHWNGKVRTEETQGA